MSPRSLTRSATRPSNPRVAALLSGSSSEGLQPVRARLRPQSTAWRLAEVLFRHLERCFRRQQRGRRARRTMVGVRRPRPVGRCGGPARSDAYPVRRRDLRAGGRTVDWPATVGHRVQLEPRPGPAPARFRHAPEMRQVAVDRALHDPRGQTGDLGAAGIAAQLLERRPAGPIERTLCRPVRRGVAFDPVPERAIAPIGNRIAVLVRRLGSFARACGGRRFDRHGVLDPLSGERLPTGRHARPDVEGRQPQDRGRAVVASLTPPTLAIGPRAVLWRVRVNPATARKTAVFRGAPRGSTGAVWVRPDTIAVTAARRPDALSDRSGIYRRLGPDLCDGNRRKAE